MRFRNVFCCLIILCFSTPARASEDATIFEGLFRAKVMESGVKFRWAPSSKDLALTYRLSRKRLGEKEVFQEVVQTRRLTADEITARFGTEFFTSVRPLLYPMEMVPTLEEKFAVANMMEEQRGMILYMADLTFPLAISLGLGHEEASMEPGQRWLYKLEAFQEGEPVGVAFQRVETGKAALPDTLTGQAVSYDWGVALKWSHLSRYTAFNVYRQAAKEKAFSKITDTPVYVTTQLDEAKRVVTAPYFYSDTKAAKGALYTYKVSGIDLFGDESQLSLPIIPIRDKSRRPAPMMPVALEQKSEAIHVSWSAAEDAEVTGYNLYRGNAYNTPFVRLNALPMKAIEYTDDEIEFKRNYFYSVTSVRDNGTESVMSLPRLLAPKDITPPAAPIGIEGIATPITNTTQSRVRLTWIPNTETDLLGYHVFKAIRADALDWAKLNDGPITTPFITDTMDKALDKKPYFYKVKAMDKAGNPSPFSEVLEITLPDVTPPPAPAWKEFSNEEKAITLSWQPLLTNDLAGYHVLRGKGNRQKKLARLSADKTSFTDTTATPGFTCHYRILAIDSSGNISAPSPFLTVKAVDKTPPTITGLTATATRSRVTLTAIIPDGDFKALTVQRKGDGEPDFSSIRSMVPLKTVADKRVDPGRSYSYRVVAFDRSGNAATSKVKKVTIPQ